jgi:hypothetical protein
MHRETMRFAGADGPWGNEDGSFAGGGARHELRFDLNLDVDAGGSGDAPQNRFERACALSWQLLICVLRVRPHSVEDSKSKLEVLSAIPKASSRERANAFGVAQRFDEHELKFELIQAVPVELAGFRIVTDAPRLLEVSPDRSLDRLGFTLKFRVQRCVISTLESIDEPSTLFWTVLCGEPRENARSTTDALETRIELKLSAKRGVHAY